VDAPVINVVEIIDSGASSGKAPTAAALTVGSGIGYDPSAVVSATSAIEAGGTRGETSVGDLLRIHSCRSNCARSSRGSGSRRSKVLPCLRRVAAYRCARRLSGTAVHRDRGRCP
jgi:hypothetical protein